MAYDATIVKSLDASAPTEGSTMPSELNDAIREIKTVLRNLHGLVAKTSNYSMAASDSIVLANPSSGSITITLPQASSCATSSIAKSVTVVNLSSSYSVVVDGYSSETIDGEATYTVYPKRSTTLVCNGTAWYSLSYKPRVRGARVYNSTDLYFGSTETTLTWDSEEYDTDSIHSTTSDTERLTVPAGVKYVRLAAHLRLRDSEESSSLTLTFYKNGSAYLSEKTYAGAMSDRTISLYSGIVPVSEGDYFHVTVRGLVNYTLASQTWFEMEIME